MSKNTDGKSEPRSGRWTWKNEIDLSGKAILLDIDGVISDASHRQHYLRSQPQDWKGFFSACVEDQPISHMVDFVSWLDASYKIVVMTARPHWVYDETVEWLNRNQIRWDLLIMRQKEQDSLSAKEFKILMAAELRKAGFEFVAGFEDDPFNVEALQQTGIPCTYVYSGYYDHKLPKEPD